MIAFKRFASLAVIVIAFLTAGWAQAIEFKSIVVFGGSVSDPGNFFALFGFQNRPPYAELDPFLVPTGPYSIGGHHSSNGDTWVEQFARPLGLSRNVQPAFRGSSPHAGNYAVAGARSTDVQETIDMREQVDAFLRDHGDRAPSDALYVIDFGGNDVRDALITGNPNILAQALISIAENVGFLYAAGARKFLFVNVANIGSLPSIRILDAILPEDVATAATALTEGFNAGLNLIIGSLPPDAEVALLNVFDKVKQLIMDPAAFGLTNVVDACVTPNVPPFSCKRPDEFLFWDGIHPTKAVHAIFAAEAANVLGP
jgi:outer membrane lipase/esterase